MVQSLEFLDDLRGQSRCKIILKLNILYDHLKKIMEFNKHLLTGDPRRTEPKKFGGPVLGEEGRNLIDKAWILFTDISSI